MIVFALSHHSENFAGASLASQAIQPTKKNTVSKASWIGNHTAYQVRERLSPLFGNKSSLSSSSFPSFSLPVRRSLKSTSQWRPASCSKISPGERRPRNRRPFTNGQLASSAHSQVKLNETQPTQVHAVALSAFEAKLVSRLALGSYCGPLNQNTASSIAKLRRSVSHRTYLKLLNMKSAPFSACAKAHRDKPRPRAAPPPLQT